MNRRGRHFGNRPRKPAGKSVVARKTKQLKQEASAVMHDVFSSIFARKPEDGQ